MKVTSLKNLFLLGVFAVGFIFFLTSCEPKDEDKTAPVITLTGANPHYMSKDSLYVEPGFTATDDMDGDVKAKVVVSGNLDIHTEGDYILKYNLTDKAGNQAIEKQREVKVRVF